MNLKLVSMLAGAMVLVAPATITAAQAQTTQLTQLFPALSGVTLTPQQQRQLEAITQKTLPEIQNVLTPEQQEKFQLALNEGKSVRVALSSLNLSSSQKKQLQSIFQATKSQIVKTLTLQQQWQIRRNARSFIE
jgi:hypothetical protein